MKETNEVGEDQTINNNKLLLKHSKNKTTKEADNFNIKKSIDYNTKPILNSKDNKKNNINKQNSGNDKKNVTTVNASITTNSNNTNVSKKFRADKKFGGNDNVHNENKQLQQESNDSVKGSFKNNGRNKRRDNRTRTRNKRTKTTGQEFVLGPRLVIRNLPPTLTQEEFLNEINLKCSPSNDENEENTIDFIKFFQYYKQGNYDINNPFKPPLYSRAYFQFESPEQINMLFINNSEFVGKYKETIKYDLTNYKPANYNKPDSVRVSVSKKRLENTIEQDPYFIRFVKNWEMLTNNKTKATKEKDNDNNVENKNTMLLLNEMSVFSANLKRELFKKEKMEKHKNFAINSTLDELTMINTRSGNANNDNNGKSYIKTRKGRGRKANNKVPGSNGNTDRKGEETSGNKENDRNRSKNIKRNDRRKSHKERGANENVKGKGNDISNKRGIGMAIKKNIGNAGDNMEEKKLKAKVVIKKRERSGDAKIVDKNKNSDDNENNSNKIDKIAGSNNNNNNKKKKKWGNTNKKSIENKNINVVRKDNPNKNNKDKEKGNNNFAKDNSDKKINNNNGTNYQNTRRKIRAKNTNKQSS
ncbi:Upf3p SCDLUD_005076 [Saccharomycodes ludwigii]|uniref:Upf3p n=1 Tax=Saccharomycodes ludwigii TaxID=36035 RepID=UPI001E86FB55|nr:hypothetical protein SCDLUD_005076 [Saccharomycodes ludwigii]KAH3898748.1 hypothetical protein SCDLUD_005076 [Saccharomycodes ludwigii]